MTFHTTLSHHLQLFRAASNEDIKPRPPNPMHLHYSVSQYHYNRSNFIVIYKIDIMQRSHKKVISLS